MDTYLFAIPVAVGMAILLFSIIIRWIYVQESMKDKKELRLQRLFNIESPLTNLGVNLITISSSFWLYTYGVNVQKDQADLKKIQDFKDSTYSYVFSSVERNRSLSQIRNFNDEIVEACQKRSHLSNSEWIKKIGVLSSTASYVNSSYFNIDQIINDYKDVIYSFGEDALTSLVQAQSSAEVNRNLENNRSSQINNVINNINIAIINGKSLDSFDNEGIRATICMHARQALLTINATMVDNLTSAFEFCIIRAAVLGDGVFKKDLIEKFRKFKNGPEPISALAIAESEFYSKYKIDNESCARFTQMAYVSKIAKEWVENAGEKRIK